MKRAEILFGILKVPMDFLMAMLALSAGYRFRLKFEFEQFPLDLGRFLAPDEYFKLALAGSVLLLVIFATYRLYTMKITATLGWEIRRIIIASLVWMMVVITYYFVIRDFPFSRLVLGYSVVLIMIFTVVGRGIVRAFQIVLLNYGFGKRRVALIGRSSINEQLSRFLESRRAYDVIGTVFARGRGGLGSLDDLAAIVKKHRLDELIQTGPLPTRTTEELVDFCREHHVTYNFVPDVLSVARSRIEILTMSNVPVITLKSTPLDGWGRVFKRAFDIACSVFFLIILFPFFLLIACAIKLDSRGPVFFRYLDDGTLAKRVGRRGRLFHCWKFRTMHDKTHGLRYTKLAEKNTRRAGPLVKIHDDPRVTRVGRVLRKFSLDELPQLWNVLQGDMSLVGPRPHLPEEVERYQKHHRFVLTLMPGITGLAQVSGRSDLDFEEEVRLDTYYIENWSPWLDVKILFRTIGVVFGGHRE